MHSACLLLLSVAWRALRLRDQGVRPPSLTRPPAPVAARSGFGSPVLRGDQFLGAAGHIFIPFGALSTGATSTCAARCACTQGGGKNAIRIFSHFPHFFSHFLGRSLSVMFKRIHSSGIV